MVDFETGVDATVEADTDGQDGHRQRPVTAGVGSDDERNRRPILTDAVRDLAGEGVREATRGQHPIGHPADSDREDPHGQVGQGREGSVLKLVWKNTRGSLVVSMDILGI